MTTLVLMLMVNKEAATKRDKDRKPHHYSVQPKDYIIIVSEEFSCFEFNMNWNTISLILKKHRIQEVIYGTFTEENL